MNQPSSRFGPFSPVDVGMGALIACVVTLIWFAGDFHDLHNSDSIIHSLNSLYQWTMFVWEYDHVGSLVSLLTRFITRPYLNLLEVSTITSVLFLTGLALWATRFTPITLTEASLWAALFLPVILTQGAIFQVGSHAVSSGAALFFSGWYVFFLQRYLSSDRHLAWLAGVWLFVPGFLAIYLSKIAFFPLAAVTAGLLWTRRPLPWRRLALIGGSLALAFLCYELLESSSPYRKDYTLDLAILPAGLPHLLKNWGTDGITGSLWLAAPALLLWRNDIRQPSIFPYLAAGTLFQIVVVSSSRWAATNSFAAYYLFDLSFLSILATIVLAANLLRCLPHPHIRRGILTAVGLTAIFLQVMHWHPNRSFDPLGQIARRLETNTPAFAAADCDLIVGDYWTAWPAMLALNDYYYRHDILDPDAGRPRRVFAITYLAASTEHLWQPILQKPNARLCSLAGDEAGYKGYLGRYAPEVAYRTTPISQVEGVIVHRIDAAAPPEAIALDFDSYAPGAGWSFPESSPTGETFTWTILPTFSLRLPVAAGRDLRLEFRVNMAMSSEILESLTLTVNDQPIRLTSARDEAGAMIFQGTIDRSTTAAGSSPVVLVFHISRTLIPQSTLPDSDDPRMLGLAFDWLRVQTISGR